MSNKRYDVEASRLSPVQSNSKPGETLEPQYTREDAVFGQITQEGPDYRSVGWKASSVLMMKTNIGLGVLSIPAAFGSLGMIPGVLAVLIISVITYWSSYYVGVFKLKHPEVYGIEDAGAKMFGRVGRELFGLTFALYWSCLAGSGMLGISISLNALSNHGTCTAVFVAVAAIIGFSFSSIQTLGRISWLAWIGLFGILTAILTLTVAVGVQDRPDAAPQEGPWSSDWQLFRTVPFYEAAAALSAIVLAFAGTPAYFNIASEMREPRDYIKALVVSQAVMTAFYLAIGVVVYYYCGSFVGSPALGSAGATMKKVCYGLALLGLIASTMLTSHFSAKYFFVRFMRGSQHLSRNTPTHWIVWFSCTFGIALFAYIIASAIPVFGGLVSLIGALLGTAMCFQPMGCMWLYDNWSDGKKAKPLRWKLMVAWCVFVIVSGTFLMIAGTYGSITSIINSYRAEGGSSAWSCADNSGS